MGILLGLAPFIAFVVMTKFAATAICLWTAAAVSAFLILRAKSRGQSPKILEVGTLALFAVLGAYTALTRAHWDIASVRSVVDGGLLLIILFSILVQRPFTLQYAREQVPPAVYQLPQFIRANYIITSVWAIAMTFVVAADLGLHYIARFPVWLAGIMIVAALAGAIGFTTWYPKKIRSHG